MKMKRGTSRLENEPKAIPQSLLTIFNSLDFPEAIIRLAIEIYGRLNLTSQPRSKGRSKLICYCIYQSYVESGIDAVDPCFVGSKLELTAEESKSAVRQRPEYKKGLVPKSPTFSHATIARAYSTILLGIDEENTNHLVSVLEKILELDKSLLIEQAKVIVTTFIYCYLEVTSSSKVNKTKLVKSLFLPQFVVNPYIDKITLLIAQV